MGGSGPSGTTTTTQNNIPWNSGNLSQIQNYATYLMDANPYQYYGGQTYAAPDISLIHGLQDVGNVGYLSGQVAGEKTPGMQGAALDANTALASGQGITDAAPWLNMLSAFGYNNPAQGAINSLMGFDNGTAAQSLGATASGAFLGANPYLDAQYEAAADPVTRQFMAATAPKTDSAMEASGRYNSGATANAQAINQQALGDTLGNMSANMYGRAYEQERGLMNQAAAQLGSLENTAYSNAGQLGVTGQNSQISSTSNAIEAFNRLLSGQQQAINATPGLSGMYTQDYQTGINSGSQIQQIEQAALNDQIARFYGVQQAPWNTASQAANIVGGAIPGLSSTTQPYFSPSPLAQIGSIGSSIAGIGSALAK